MTAFERLVEMPSRPSTVATNKSTDESPKSGTLEIFGLKMGAPFALPDCDDKFRNAPCVDTGDLIHFARGREPEIVRGALKASTHEGLLATLDFEIKNDDGVISQFNQKFGSPRIEVQNIQNLMKLSAVLKIYKWINSSGVIKIECNSFDPNRCSVYVTSQHYIKFLENGSRRQPL